MYSPHTLVYPEAEIGDGTTLGPFVIIGHPPRNAAPDAIRTIIGANSNIRSHSVIYAGVRTGRQLECGHHVLIRESSVLGDLCSIGTGSVVEHHVRLGDRVRIHSNAFVPEYCVLHDDCWLGPNVVLTNAKFPKSRRVKEMLAGVQVREGAIIGANATVLPGLSVGRRALIGAGSVVTRDVQPETVVVGNPAREICKLTNLSYPEMQELAYPTEE